MSDVRHVNGIATQYRGARFRSRLEARWAQMFDVLGWPWVYEPVDLDGYIPDFVLKFDAGPMLIEVKPAFDLDGLRAAARKIDAAGWRSKNPNSALVVGADWCIGSDPLPPIGLLRQDPGAWYTEDEGSVWDLGLWFRCVACANISIFHWRGSFVCSGCGAYDGDHHLKGPLAHETLVEYWNGAGSKVQWKAP